MGAIESLPVDLQRVGRRTTAVLFAGQSLVSAAAIATATVMTIVGEELMLLALTGWWFLRRSAGGSRQLAGPVAGQQ